MQEQSCTRAKKALNEKTHLSHRRSARRWEPSWQAKTPAAKCTLHPKFHQISRDTSTHAIDSVRERHGMVKRFDAEIRISYHEPAFPSALRTLIDIFAAPIISFGDFNAQRPLITTSLSLHRSESLA
ncbi:hypothetical protein O181_029713 [Austropuccinia psidii MF-1]|uniref:Uncharacterized protein n=1 Tax=Austropuccinia psidii MF-1 TaxID=1389203 RepID=A0A9Q3H300_9BASI|nr:hypothetical protein [Austropuccinia psidii MF-1]